MESQLQHQQTNASVRTAEQSRRQGFKENSIFMCRSLMELTNEDDVRGVHGGEKSIKRSAMLYSKVVIDVLVLKKSIT